MSKRTGYLIWIIVGVLATAGAAFSLIDASKQDDDFRLFRRIVMLVIFIVMTVRYIMKYLKEGRGISKEEAVNHREQRL
jgi:hypothetical protein